MKTRNSKSRRVRLHLGGVPAALLLGVLAAVDGRATGAIDALTAQAEEPRAFGYQVGDVLSRTIIVDAPDGLALDEASLPRVGRLGQAFELRRADWHRLRGGRHRLALEYQVFLSPTAVRTLELPPINLHFVGLPRSQDLRIDAWPVTVAPLVPVDVSPRRGLGEMQPDSEAPVIDTSSTRQRLLAYGAAIAPMLLYLARVYIGLPWLSRRQRPFESAWRTLRGLGGTTAAERHRAVLQTLHAALNRSAGVVLFEQGIDAYLAAQPRFVGMRDDLIHFFDVSRRVFFDTQAAAPTDAATDDAVRWLLDFCRRCRDAERGSA